jgi:hypothetical protein
MSNDSIQVLVSLEESVTHHLNDLSLAAIQQEVYSNVLSNKFVNAFTQYCDDLYPIKLRSTSLAIAGIVKQTKVNSLWKVLFDLGSDKTIIK